MKKVPSVYTLFNVQYNVHFSLREPFLWNLNFFCRKVCVSLCCNFFRNNNYFLNCCDPLPEKGEKKYLPQIYFFFLVLFGVGTHVCLTVKNCFEFSLKWPMTIYFIHNKKGTDLIEKNNLEINSTLWIEIDL